MIELKEYSLNKRDYVKILVENRLRRRWWAFLIIVLAGIYIFLLPTKNSMEFFIMIFPAVYFPLIFIYLYYYANSSKNKIFFLKRKIFLDEKILIAEIEDGTKNEFRLSHINKILERKTYWLLYISVSQFIYIPAHAFKNADDKEKFTAILDSLNLK